MKGSSLVEDWRGLVYVSITSFIVRVMSIKHKGDRVYVCVCGGGGGDLVVCLSPPHHVAPETGARLRVHTRTLSEESSLALC